ncbi:MAG: uroporphyrinogen-III C-methyltransferase [Candidatus Sedimenticola sp. PURPLELP]
MKVNDSAKVFIVGAGPGDPDLLTLKAYRLLRSAEVVVYDRLVSQEILDLVPTTAQLVPVGKESGRHCVPQDQINEILVELASKNRNILRLKGGDPFVFGRGSEEAMHLVKAGIAFEIVPGITAAAACTAYSGIPLTHRGISRSVRFLTGHLLNDSALELDWNKIADPESTLVIYMGLATLDEITQKLISSGLPAETPAAAIENGTTPKHRSITSTLTRLSSDVKANAMQAPVLLVIGEVVTLSAEIGNWFNPSEADQEINTLKLAYG